MRKPMMLLAAALLLTPGPALAQEDDLVRADAELNRLYQQIQSRLRADAAGKQSLTQAQRAWIAFRDAECSFSSRGVEGGSAYSEVVQACRADLTARRIADFNAYLKCAEGDLSCPVPAR